MNKFIENMMQAPTAPAAPAIAPTAPAAPAIAPTAPAAPANYL